MPNKVRYCRSATRWLMNVTVAVLFCIPCLSAQERSSSTDSDLYWLNNNTLKVGLKLSSGGAIAWIGEANSNRNLINSFDRGRLIQQSWYGQMDDSLWNQQPWRWNPVQGGDWKGKPAHISKQHHTQTTSFVQSRPVHWATGQDLEDCVMEQTITLHTNLIQIHYRFHYSGTLSHPALHQELPAVFLDASLSTLVIYDGHAPWTGGPLSRYQPKFPNEYKRIPEHWAAYVDNQGVGIGCYVPVADELTCYRYGTESTQPDSCSYFAPICTLAIIPGFKFEYDSWVTTGTVEQIRTRFQQLR